jgi:hypothetical protein
MDAEVSMPCPIVVVYTRSADFIESGRTPRHGSPHRFGLGAIEPGEIGAVASWGHEEMAEVRGPFGGGRYMKDDDVVLLEQIPARYVHLAGLLSAYEAGVGCARHRSRVNSRGPIRPAAFQDWRRAANASATTLPFALPFEAFITWPRRNCATLSSPPQ